MESNALQVSDEEYEAGLSPELCQEALSFLACAIREDIAQGIASDPLELAREKRAGKQLMVWGAMALRRLSRFVHGSERILLEAKVGRLYEAIQNMDSTRTSPGELSATLQLAADVLQSAAGIGAGELGLIRS
jgi:hypothetical protein